MSKVEVNQISSQCGSTLTIGQSGDTVTLACGATQTGFGRTGTVDWDTTAKTASFTAVSGNGYFVNTTSGAVTMTLPASPSAGDIVAFKDYASTFATNNLTIGRNGSNLDGNAGDKAISTSDTSMSLVYVDATQGWKSVEEGTGFIGEKFIVATGGTITTDGDFKVHSFTGPGTFSVSQISATSANNEVSYIVVAGGGSGGSAHGGGGGAGGFRESKSGVDTYSPASPLEGATNITVTATDFPIAVGAGGAAVSVSTGSGNSGSNSSFSTITSAGGGGGGGEPNGLSYSGGSSGGQFSSQPKGSGNTPPTTPPQGTDGGNANHNPPGYGEGGGGGATVGGTNGTTTKGGDGGAGATTSITGSAVSYAGGGGGSAYNANPAGTGGTGGGGNGSSHNNSSGTAGTANTGGGGGGGERCIPNTDGFAGGSGIVIIRYKYQ